MLGSVRCTELYLFLLFLILTMERKCFRNLEQGLGTFLGYEESGSREEPSFSIRSAGVFSSKGR